MPLIIDEEDYLAHYGMPRRSGRYPWGSGETPYQRSGDFLSRVQELRKEGYSETQIAEAVGITTTQLRAYKSIALKEKRHNDILQAQKLKDSGMSNLAIAKEMGISDHKVADLLAPGAADKADILNATSKMLMDKVDEKGWIDVGEGNERWIGVSKEHMKAALEIAEAEGYEVHVVKQPQVSDPTKSTTFMALTPPGTEWDEVRRNTDKIQTIDDYSEDGGRTFNTIQRPLSIDSSRIQVVYGDEGGAERDGMMYIRPGVDDISIGGSAYAQVRVAVDGTHYLKGMAMYKTDMPDGVDILFNTNKKDTGNKLDALKEMKSDPDNPFGAQIKRQITDENGKVTSSMNILHEEGDWNTWSDNLSSQVLSKQPKKLAKAQLDLAYSEKLQELDDIKALTNPSVKKKLLQSYADQLDSDAVHLKAAALPRQKTKVLLPMPELKDNEVYAPTYRDGEMLALVRYPHAGTFEIPEVVVRNHGKIKKKYGVLPDAIGVNSKVAERLSGADFDGDFVLAIPNNQKRVKSTPALESLKGFDPKKYAYPKEITKDPGFKKMTDQEKGLQMGSVSNLITDMTIKGAKQDEIARAVKHSMVVIDAQKHDLNWKKSAEDNGISALKKKYQGAGNGGASTLISKSTSELRLPEFRPRSAAKGGPIDKKTGKVIYEETGRTKKNKKGETVNRITKTTQGAMTDDLRTLSSGSEIEMVYATHGNKLKALANEARKEMVSTKTIPYSPSAKKAYAAEVNSLDKQLDRALKNAPRERQAQAIANSQIRAIYKEHPEYDKDDMRKARGRALVNARAQTHAKKDQVTISDREWEAIQAGAVSAHKLDKILQNADLDVVREKAMPKRGNSMTKAKEARAKAMLNSGYTIAEVADQLGVSATTISKLD